MSSPAYVYGRSFTFNLYTFEDRTQITNLPAQTIQAYCFRDQPSRADASSGSGALSSPTQILAGGNANISLTIPAIVDQDPTNLLSYRLHWIAVNLILQAGGQVQTIIKAIKVERASGQDSEIGVTLQSIQDIYPDVLSFLSSGEINAMITLAKADLLDDLTNRGIDWNQVHRPDQLSNALLFNTLTYIYNSQIQREGDRFYVSSAKSQARYESIKANLKLAFDATQAGDKTNVVKTGGQIRMVR